MRIDPKTRGGGRTQWLVQGGVGQPRTATRKSHLSTKIFLLLLKITRESMSERVYWACDEPTDAPEPILTNNDLNGLEHHLHDHHFSFHLKCIKSSPVREAQAPKPGQEQSSRTFSARLFLFHPQKRFTFIRIDLMVMMMIMGQTCGTRSDMA